MSRDNKDIIIERKMQIKFNLFEKRITKVLTDNFEGLRKEMQEMNRTLQEHSNYLYGDPKVGDLGLKRKVDQMYEVYEDWQPRLEDVGIVINDWKEDGEGIKSLVDNASHWTWLIKNMKWIIGLFGIGTFVSIARFALDLMKNNTFILDLLSSLFRGRI